MAMSKQEIFDRVATHLLRQGRRSVGMTGQCQYRSDYSGDKCAVGVLIPDAYYHRMLEGQRVCGSSVVEVLQLSGVLGNDAALGECLMLLEELQNLHDRVFVLDWPGRLRHIASAYYLNDYVVANYDQPLLPTSLPSADEQAERAAKAAISKAQTAERKDLTPSPELVV